MIAYRQVNHLNCYPATGLNYTYAADGGLTFSYRQYLFRFSASHATTPKLYQSKTKHEIRSYMYNDLVDFDAALLL